MNTCDCTAYVYTTCSHQKKASVVYCLIVKERGWAWSDICATATPIDRDVFLEVLLLS